MFMVPKPQTQIVNDEDIWSLVTLPARARARLGALTSEEALYAPYLFIVVSWCIIERPDGIRCPDRLVFSRLGLLRSTNVNDAGITKSSLDDMAQKPGASRSPVPNRLTKRLMVYLGSVRMSGQIVVPKEITCHHDCLHESFSQSRRALCGTVFGRRVPTVPVYIWLWTVLKLQVMAVRTLPI